jgi:intraflagellar transport protein 140
MAVAGDESALDTLTSWRPRTAARNLSHAGVKDNHCFYVGTQSGILYYINQTGTCTEVLRSDTAPIVQVLWHPKRYCFWWIFFPHSFLNQFSEKQFSL